MQRKGYILGTTALLTALLAGCTGSSGLGETPDDSKPGDLDGTSQAAQPGRYRTLPAACRAVDRGTLDKLLPGIKDLTEEQRNKAYEGTAAVTYDTDRSVGCDWKVESAEATHRLVVDFERVVSYDGSVSDDERAQEVYARKQGAADLPSPSASAQEDSADTEDTDSPSSDASDDASHDTSDSSDPSGESTANQGDKNEKDKKGNEGEKGNQDGDKDAAGEVPEALQPRVLDELGDEAFLDDRLIAATSTSRHRTVTVVFRTSNVIVTVEYDEQPARGNEVPDSKELQDKARELAAALGAEFTD